MLWKRTNLGGKQMTLKLHMNIGNDIGNSEIDMYINGHLIRQPNVYSLIGQMPWKDDDVEVQKNLKNIYDNLVVSIISSAVPTGMYTVGTHALKTKGENVTNLYVKGNESKSDQLVPYINTLALVAARAVQEAHLAGESLDEIKVVADMGTALPVKQCSPENVATYRKKFMGETHTVTVHLGLTKKVNVSIDFDYVHVLQEGTPVTFALQMDIEGNWRTNSYEPSSDETNDLYSEFAELYDLEDVDGSYFDGKNILHVDMGDGTTDTPFTRGDAVDNDFCDGVNNGIGHALRDAIPDLVTLAPHAFNSVTRQQYSEILKSQYTSRKHKFLNEAIQAFNPHCENQTTQIVHHVNDQVFKIGPNEIDVVVVYGGGSILTRSIIFDKLKEMCDKTRIQLFYVPAKYAVTLNAEGLDYFVRSEIYAHLKKNYMSSAEYTAVTGKNHAAQKKKTNATPTA